ncbi:hypothetical protein CTAYLR_001217 [Chrysophaeum taylorii]|uniref:Fructose-bisphosphate aldolase n=1 Tax=Chrysophaeum taylorii TaxID=2483200 RepID=A0AAD7XK55_9STRA|nr:hypothetical protein CTAYLR_001217 [Chrysophaeum taylorii]
MFRSRVLLVLRGSGRRGLRVGVIGAGNMGKGIAGSLARAGHEVFQYDRDTEAARKSAAQHASMRAVESIRACCEASEAVVVSVSNEAAERTVFLGEGGVFEGAPRVVMNAGTTSVAWARELHAAAPESAHFLDAPVSGGPEGAAQGRLSVMVGGRAEAYEAAVPVLEGMAAFYARLGEAGAGAAAKLVNQHLVAANAHAAAEALGLARALGCDLAQLSGILERAWGRSTMLSRASGQLVEAPEAGRFGDRRAFASLLDVASAAPLRNFVKDVALVREAAAAACVRVPSADVAAAALDECAKIGRLDADWAAVTALLGKKPYTSHAELEAAAPAPIPTEVAAAWREEIAERVSRAGAVPVVDDDPTGTQTVHGVSVLSYPWRQEDLEAEMKTASCFFVLANTRALDEPEAEVRAEAIGSALRPYGCRAVVSRSDSTLRGHFPAEVRALARGLGWTKPLVVLAPFFFEGGRITADDVHYVARGDDLVPAGETEFATDAAFGYVSSNLRDWIREKGLATSVASVDLTTLRAGPDAPARVCDLLVDFYRETRLDDDDDFPVVVANALNKDDAAALALGCLLAEERLFASSSSTAGGESGLIFRSAASIVAARCAVPERPLLSDDELDGTTGPRSGLVVVGSYVGKTTTQLDALFRASFGATWLSNVEIDARRAASPDAETRRKEVDRVSRDLDTALDAGRSAVLYTSRDVVRDDETRENSSRTSSLAIGDRVNAVLCDVVSRAVRGRGDGLFLVAKGGITSNDVAVKSLGVRRARVLGQVRPGIPAWRLGPETAAPGAAYVVFPGNVGADDDLANVVARMAKRPLGVARPRVQEILLEARGRGRAVGAFNIYNLEGALAVRRAVEKTGLPAIVQFHPASLEFGGTSLIAACKDVAARAAAAPLLVALDHATDDASIDAALEMGVDAIMADGARLNFADNVRWTASVVARAAGAGVEAELGMLAGEEDGLSVAQRDAKMTDPSVVSDFVSATGVHALACTVGNVHGATKLPVEIDWARLDAIKAAAPEDLPLVLHGASGLPPDVLHRAIRSGICKLNVNTEVRAASRRAIKDASEAGKDVLNIMNDNVDAMAAVVEAKMRAFAPPP